MKFEITFRFFLKIFKLKKDKFQMFFLKKLKNHGFSKACYVLAEMGAHRFEQAAEVISRCERAQVRPAIMMMEIYRRILTRLMRRGWKNLSLPVGVSKAGKLWIALRYGYL